MDVRINTIGADLVEKSFKIAAATIEARVTAKVRHFAQMLETRVKANAAGRPGPNIVTGDYVRSINTTFGRKGTTILATVGTNKPQGRRLEYGFVGADSLGRHYNQAPLPHWGPAVTLIEPEFVAAIQAEAHRA